MAIIPKRGDRSAWDSIGYPELHAVDLELGTPLQHLPTGAVFGQAPVWDGTQYVPSTVGGGGGIVYYLEYDEVTVQTIYSLTVMEAIVFMSVTITEAWDGTGASLKVGIVGNDDLFFSTTELDLTEEITFEKSFQYAAVEDIIVTFDSGAGASTGAVTIIVQTNVLE